MLVLIQIVLGVAYRHKQTGVLPHIGWAVVVALALLTLPVMLLQQFGQHPSLRPAALAVLSIALLQVRWGSAPL